MDKLPQRRTIKLPSLKDIPVVLAWIGLALVLLGAVMGLRLTIIVLTTEPIAARSWGDLGPLFIGLLGLLIANAGAILTLISGIIAEFTSKPRYIWFAMIAVSLACILSYLRDLLEVKLIVGLIFLSPVITCLITGVIIGLMRRLKRKPERS